MKTILSSEKAFIIRTERGLTIAGTRITLYDVIDLIKAQYPSHSLVLCSSKSNDDPHR